MSEEGFSIDAYTRRIFYRALALVLAVTSILLLAGQKPWAKGVALGGSASIVNLFLMVGEVRKQVAITAKGSAWRAATKHILRLMVLAAALIYAARSEDIALWAAIPAIFTSQIILFGGELLGRQE